MPSTKTVASKKTVATRAASPIKVSSDKKNKKKKDRAPRKSLDEQNFSKQSMMDMMAAGGTLAGRRSTENLEVLDNFSVKLTNFYVGRAVIIAKLFKRKNASPEDFGLVQFMNTREPVYVVASPKRKKQKKKGDGKKKSKKSE